MKQYDTLDAFLADMPAHLDALRGHDGLFLLETRSGRGWYVRLQNGDIRVTATAEDAVEKPDCTVRAEEETLLQLIAGQASPMKLLLTRRITVAGNAGKLMALIPLMKR